MSEAENQCRNLAQRFSLLSSSYWHPLNANQHNGDIVRSSIKPSKLMHYSSNRSLKILAGITLAAVASVTPTGNMSITSAINKVKAEINQINTATRACERAIKNKLVFPSSFEQVDVERYSQTITITYSSRKNERQSPSVRQHSCQTNGHESSLTHAYVTTTGQT